MVKLDENSQFERFTKVMDGLMAVPYQELQGELKKHKARRAKKRQQAKRRASRVSKGSA